MSRFRIFKEQFPRFKELQKEVLAAIERSGNWLYDDPASNPENQIMVQCQNHDVEDWYKGTGRSAIVNDNYSKEFCCIQPSLRNTAVEDYINWLEVPVYRTRIMVMRPKTSYSMHNDSSPRIHMPIITNKHSFFIFKDPAELIHMPANGTAYWTDTRHDHSFMNGGNEIRFHIVAAVD